MLISHKVIGEHLRAARKRKRMTQMDVAVELDISYRHYGHIERGERPASLEMLGKLCALLEVGFDEILAGAYLGEPYSGENLSKERQIEKINSMIKGCSEQTIDMIAEVVETIVRYEKG